MPNVSSSIDHRPADPNDTLLAALDLGTNNCRLLIARPQNDGFAVVDSFSRIVRLGEGLGASGRLSSAAMTRTVAALRICAGLMDRRGATRQQCVATEACRRAANGPAFLDRVREETGIMLEVLSHDQEIAFAVLGCLPLIDGAADHAILVDIGGGSTELAWLDRRPGAHRDRLSLAVSLPIGVVTLTEAFAAEPDAATYRAMVRHVQSLLLPIEAAHRLRPALDGGHVQMLGTSGTVTTLAAIWLGLERYDRRQVDGLVIDPDAIGAVSERLRGMTNASRASHPCIGNGRADLVVAGCAILEAILQCWPADTMRVADRWLREGILHGLMGRTLAAALAESQPPAPSPVRPTTSA
jgi:exopolyphosphatase/guanosine-5'-triphosphate,3'-diphosphate pyrophosphatase